MARTFATPLNNHFTSCLEAQLNFLLAMARQNCLSTLVLLSSSRCAVQSAISSLPTFLLTRNKFNHLSLWRFCSQLCRFQSPGPLWSSSRKEPIQFWCAIVWSWTLQRRSRNAQQALKIFCSSMFKVPVEYLSNDLAWLFNKFGQNK